MKAVTSVLSSICHPSQGKLNCINLKQAGLELCFLLFSTPGPRLCLFICYFLCGLYELWPLNALGPEVECSGVVLSGGRGEPC